MEELVKKLAERYNLTVGQRADLSWELDELVKKTIDEERTRLERESFDLAGKNEDEFNRKHGRQYRLDDSLRLIVMVNIV